MATTTSVPERPAAQESDEALRAAADPPGGGAAGPERGGGWLRQGAVPRRVPRRCAVPLSRADRGRAAGRREGGRRGPRLRRRPTSTPPRSTARPTSRPSVIRGPGRPRRAGDGRAGRVGRPGDLADGLLQDPGGDRRPLRVHGRVRQRAPLDRPAGAGPLRHARAEGEVAPSAGHAARRSRRSR